MNAAQVLLTTIRDEDGTPKLRDSDILDVRELLTLRGWERERIVPDVTSLTTAALAFARVTGATGATTAIERSTGSVSVTIEIVPIIRHGAPYYVAGPAFWHDVEPVTIRKCAECARRVPVKSW